jgi:hypothetical protein
MMVPACTALCSLCMEQPAFAHYNIELSLAEAGKVITQIRRPLALPVWPLPLL